MTDDSRISTLRFKPKTPVGRKVASIGSKA
jgi:hypothetical protein